MMLQDADVAHSALMLITIDDFAALRTTRGQAGLDRIIERVASVIRTNFRSVDNICRLQESEFVIIMSRMSSVMQEQLFEKIGQINETLKEIGEQQIDQNTRIPVSVSVGIAFSDREDPQGDVFKDAEIALRRMEKTGRQGIAVYEGRE